MNNLRNHITLIGNMGSNPQITNFDNGNKVARFQLATDRSFRANDGKIKSSTEWHKVFAWGNIAGFIESYGEKGKKVAIHGRVVNRTYLNTEGKKRNVTEVEVQHIIGL
ncbi:MAG: single-stranded DNA-binding protein [Bacteroidetes bacterium]|nr:MAG: single-stranded DNA-binding protein [Bacteroidota bacterium]